MFNLGLITDLSLTFIFYFNSIIDHPEYGRFWQEALVNFLGGVGMG